VDPLEFLARLTAHIPNKHQVMTRYYGYYANRVRGARKRLGAAPQEPPPVAEPVSLALREARRRWAELLQQIFEVDRLRCPTCGAEMRIVAFITERAVIDRILDHLRRTRESVRGPPSPPRRARATHAPHSRPKPVDVAATRRRTSTGNGHDSGGD
jgi:AcrR family transcriptional regulator